MNKNISKLTDLPCGQSARIAKLTSTAAIRQRMLDLGMIEHTLIEHLQTAPGGNPSAYLVRGTVVALRKEDASQILIYQTEY